MTVVQILGVMAAAFFAAFGWGIAHTISRLVSEYRARKRRDEVRFNIEVERRAHCRTRLP